MTDETEIRNMLNKKPEYLDHLKRLVRYQEDNIADWNEARYPECHGIEWGEVNISPFILYKMMEAGVLIRTMASNRTKVYKIKNIEACKKVIGEVETAKIQSINEGPKDGDTPDDLFDTIIGYDEIKEIFKMSIMSDQPTHALMVGPPASAKTMFLLELARLPHSVYALGSHSSKAGIFNLLADRKPRILLIDELDKMSMEDYSALLSVMETGIVAEVKCGKTRTSRVLVWVYACCNRMDRIPPEVISRFQPLVLRFEPYDEKNFHETVVGVLRKEGVKKKLAEYISNAVWTTLEVKDVRAAIKTARMAKTQEDVDKVIAIIGKYSAMDDE